ncbi:hypothetical protein E5347_01650 [Clostridium sartagoforme]|uniref:Uncharacterized protein n=1 Tax=Clostridium sartagoforme TaxID=84031 RepID=A0A4S2DQV2_9CLOT|nr:hypothetical protein [Clostridium sartagoforme]TGY43543.1 hypothetical protein E5347_01650 [Clostridium sartagoforme]
MKGVYSWVYVDYKSNLWKFSIKDNGELSYAVMYSEGKWTKSSIIDSKATSYSIFIDDGGGVHLVYGNTKGELRYCTMKDNKWLGKTIYNLENKEYEIENIKMVIIGSNMHIFYAAISKDGSDHGIILHCLWNGSKTNVTKVEDIILKEDIYDYYSIKTTYRNDICLFYLSDDGDEVSFNYSIFQNNRWRESKRLYGIQGEEIYFDVKIENTGIHILNKSKENSIYHLDHVIVDSNQNLSYINISSGKEDIRDSLIFKKDDKIFATWLQNDSIYYSLFLGDKWDEPTSAINNSEEEIGRYNIFLDDRGTNYIASRSVYGTKGLDLFIYDPVDFLYTVKSDSHKEWTEVILNNKETKVFKEELGRVKEENKALVEKIDYLTSLDRKNQESIERYQIQLSRALEQKRKAEENSNIFVELQKKLQADYEEVSEILKLKEEENSRVKGSLDKYNSEISLLKGRLKKYELQEITLREDIISLNKINNSLKDEVNIFKEENEELTREIIGYKRLDEENKEYISNLKQVINDLKEEVLVIKKEISLLLEENRRLNTELEIERNQSVMERILKRRS